MYFLRNPSQIFSRIPRRNVSLRIPLEISQKYVQLTFERIPLKRILSDLQEMFTGIYPIISPFIFQEIPSENRPKIFLGIPKKIHEDFF